MKKEQGTMSVGALLLQMGDPDHADPQRQAEMIHMLITITRFFEIPETNGRNGRMKRLRFKADQVAAACLTLCKGLHKVPFGPGGHSDDDERHTDDEDE